VAFLQEVLTGERRNHNPDAVLPILCPDVVRMMNLTLLVGIEQVTSEVNRITILVL